MKFITLLVVTLFATSMCGNLRRSAQSEDVDVDVSLEDIFTDVTNVNTGVGVNKSNIIVLSKVNFGTIVQQLGDFQVAAQETQKILQQAEVEENVNTDVDISDVATDVTNVNTAVGVNESNIVNLSNVNFGTIVQQLGKFAGEVNDNVLRLSEPEANSDVNTDVNLANIFTDVTNVNTAVGVNESNIVVLDSVNFGTIVQQLGDFEVAGNNSNTNNKLSQSENVNTDVSLEDVATDVTNVNTGVAVNKSNIVQLSNVNFGTIVQNIGDFNIELEGLLANAKGFRQNMLQE